MVKNDLANQLSERIGLSHTGSLYIIDNVLHILTQALADGEKISLRGLGTFKVVDCPERTARDITRDVMVTIPARKAVRFKASKILKDCVNG